MKNLRKVEKLGKSRRRPVGLQMEGQVGGDEKVSVESRKTS